MVPRTARVPSTRPVSPFKTFPPLFPPRPLRAGRPRTRRRLVSQLSLRPVMAWTTLKYSSQAEYRRFERLFPGSNW
jgi:hypothetical protein